jgi:hypothetical protein
MRTSGKQQYRNLLKNTFGRLPNEAVEKLICEVLITEALVRLVIQEAERRHSELTRVRQENFSTIHNELVARFQFNIRDSAIAGISSYLTCYLALVGIFAAAGP